MSKPTLLKTARKRTVVEETIDQLYELIKQKHIGLGDKLPSEREMAESLGISRSSLREAISSLQQMGVVKVSHGSGIAINDSVLGDSVIRPMRFLMALEEISPAELFEARIVIESQCALLAAEKATQEDIESLTTILDQVEEHALEKEIGIDFELEFHEKVASVARQRVLLVMLMSISELLRETMQVTVPSEGVSAATIESHKELLGFLASHDGPSASKNMMEHIETIRNRYTRTS